MNLSSNKRIAVNVLVSYLRTLIMVICGIFTGRWALLALGDLNYGLASLIGGLDIFVVYFNYILSAAIARYYAYSLGLELQGETAKIIECQKWFNVSFVIHLFMPFLLLLFTLPIGVYAIRYWLVIPQEKITTCVWGYLIANVNILISFIGVPYQAMMLAKQEIAELTIYNLVPTVLRICFLGYIVSHPGDWLGTYFSVLPAISILFSIFIVIRASFKYPECSIHLKFMKELDRYKQLFIYSFWLFVGGCGDLCSRQGIVVLVNKMFGPVINASYGIAGTVSGQANQLAGALSGAITPAIATAYGSKQYSYAHKLAYAACKLSSILVLLFAIPLFIELPEVMRLWLKNPPEYCIGLCRCILLCLIIDKLCIGHNQAMRAVGEITANQIVNGITLALVTPIAFVMIKLGGRVYSIGYSLVLANLVMMLGAVWLARSRGGLSIQYWTKHILVPILLICCISSLLGIACICLLSQSFVRIVVTTVVCNASTLLLFWLCLLDKSEQSFVLSRIKSKIKRH